MRLGEIVDLVENWYPPARAESWDRVGLVCGDPDSEVTRILLAVDPVLAVAEEAVACAAELLIVHHPLYLHGTSSVAATTPKGRVVHTLVSNGVGLLAAHTNADAPDGGVSDALARALGLIEPAPLEVSDAEPRDKIIVFVPIEAADRVRAALADAGAGRIGDYDQASFSAPGTGRFRPLPGASPAIGVVGEPEQVAEERVEVVAPRHVRGRVLSALLAAHPYEEPAFDVVELASQPDPRHGTGRIGALATPLRLADFAARVASVLPPTAGGVRVAGNPDRLISTVALCGGSGDSYLAQARASGADLYLTSDLRHHPASEFLEQEGPALVDVAHWAAEWMWLPVLQRRLQEHGGDTVEVQISTLNTDPWTFRV